MRYLLLVVSLLLVLVSCSTQTESNTDREVSLIVGTWKPVKEVDVCTTGSEQVYQYDACQQEGQYEFIQDTDPDLETGGTILVTEKNSVDQACQTTYQKIGTWNLAGGSFTLNLDGEIINPTFFELIPGRLRIGYYESDSLDSCDGDNLLSHYYTEFVKL